MMDKTTKDDKKWLAGNALLIEKTLEAFGLTVRIVDINNFFGADRYNVEIAMGVKIEDILARKKELALALASPTGSVHIEAPIPGRALVGIWVPRKRKGKLTPMSSTLLLSLVASSLYRLSAVFGCWADRLNGGQSPRPENNK